MGCDDNPQVNEVKRESPSLEIQLEQQKRDLTYQVDSNSFKIGDLEKKIEEYDRQIREGENDIKLNQYQLKEEELKSKARKLIEIKRNRARDQKTLEQISTMNEGLKNNLDAIEKKIIENQNFKALKKQNEIMGQYERQNVGQIVTNNVVDLKRQKEEDDKIQRILQRGNDAYIGNDNLKDEDAYLKNLLGNGTLGNQF